MKPISTPSTPENSASVAFSPEQYTISIRKEKIEGDTYVVGRVTEFPDAVVYEESGPAAYEAIVAVLADLIEHLREIGKEVPAPQVIPEEFSGRVTFRMPRSLHARVDARAQLEGVSINTWLVAAAENYLGATGQGARGMPNTLFLGSGIASVGMTASLTPASETAVRIIKKAIIAASTTYVSIDNAIFAVGSRMGTGVSDEPEDESPVRQH